MPQGRLVVASARLPITLTRKSESWDVSPSTGGLVTALAPVREERPFLWIGLPGVAVADADRAVVSRRLASHGALPVFASKADVDGFYLGFSNQVLWPLFHNLTDKVSYETAAYRAYRRVNEAIAQTILQHTTAGDTVWVHDYQLMLVPELLRRQGFRGRIGFFLHIPFPSAETYRQLPPRADILHGLLGADFIGFHTYEYVSHFRGACLRVLGLESEISSLRVLSRTVRLGSLPIGLDADEVEQMVSSADGARELDALTRAHAGKTIVVGVDRLDYTKGIPQKLRAFEDLLVRNPKLRDRVVLVQVAARAPGL